MTKPVRKVAVALGALVLLAAVELGVRTVLVGRSADLSRLPAYRARAAELVRCQSSIAVIGSSLAEAIDPRRLEAALALPGDPSPCVAVFAVDRAGATTWGAMVWHTFWSTGNNPDALLIVAAAYSLNDEADDVDIGRLARYFDDHGAWPALESAHLLSRSQWRDYAISRRSAIWAFRRRLGRRLLPGTTEACAECASAPGLGERPARLVEGTNVALRQILEDAAAAGTRVAVILVPVRDERLGIPAATGDLLAQDGILLLDLQQTPGISRVDFVDNMHLGPVGAARLTQVLGDSLARYRDRLRKTR